MRLFWTETAVTQGCQGHTAAYATHVFAVGHPTGLSLGLMGGRTNGADEQGGRADEWAGRWANWQIHAWVWDGQTKSDKRCIVRHTMVMPTRGVHSAHNEECILQQ